MVTGDKIVKQVNNISIHSNIAFEILQLCTEKDIEISRLLKIISSDHGLSVQILMVANASYFNFPRSINSLDRAVVAMGFDRVKDIALSLSVKTLFGGKEVWNKNLFSLIWKHAFYTALTMKVLAENYDSQNKDILYTGGLMHDLGKVILMKRFGPEYGDLLKDSFKNSYYLPEREETLLGVNHSEVGADVLDYWNFPENLVLMTRYHHSPEEYKSGDKIDFWIRLIYIGNLLTQIVEKGFTQLSDLKKIDSNFKDYLTISEKEFSRLIVLCKKEFIEHRDILNFFGKN